MSIFVIIFILLFGFYTSKIFVSKSNYLNNSIYLLWIYHIVLGLGYYWFSLNNSADALRYWRVASVSNFNDIVEYYKYGGGTAFMFVFNYLPASVLKLSYLAGTFIHIYIGYVGILFFIHIAEKVIPYNSKFLGITLFPFIFFLPNLHFWASGVGKDTLSLFSIGLFAYSLLKLKRRWYLALFAITFLYFIRSHVALMLMITASFGFLISGKVNNYVKFFVSLILFVGALYILPQVMEYTGLQDLDLESFTGRAEEQAGLLTKDSGSAVDVSSYPLPLKVVTFLYRPTFTDINSFPTLIAAFENLFLLLLTITVLRRNFLSSLRSANTIIIVLFVFLILGTIVFSISLGNMGIMLRMRNMFLPGMLIYFLWALSWQNVKKREKNTRSLLTKQS